MQPFGAKLDDGQGMRRILEGAAQELAHSMAPDDVGRADAYQLLIDSIPRLYELHLARGGPAGNLSIFALSFTEFTKRVRSRNMFEGIVLNDDLIEAAFDAHCRGGELFVFSGGDERPSGVPVSKADIEIMHGLDVDSLDTILSEGLGIISDLHAISTMPSMRGNLGENSALLSDARPLFRQGDVPSMALLAKMLLSDGMRIGLQGFMDRFEEWFLVDLSDIMLAGAQATLEQTEKGDLEGTISEVEELLERVGEGSQAIKQFACLCKELKGVLGVLAPKEDGSDPWPEHERWKSFLEFVSMFTHDYANMLGKVIGSVQLMDAKLSLSMRGSGDGLSEVDKYFRDALRLFDSSEVSTLMRLVKWMLKKRSGGKIVVGVGEVGSLQIPPQVRRPLFRILFELGHNAAKYSVPGTREHRIDLGARQEGQWLNFSVEDNGVGIEDVEKVMSLGVRERPDLADGTGTGLASVMDLADGIGARVSMDSVLGAGTRVTVSIDSSGWSRGGSNGGGCIGGGSGGGAGRLTITRQAVLPRTMAFGANSFHTPFRPFLTALP